MIQDVPNSSSRAIKKQADHLENLLEDEFIQWFIIAHAWKQVKDYKSRV